MGRTVFFVHTLKYLFLVSTIDFHDGPFPSKDHITVQKKNCCRENMFRLDSAPLALALKCKTIELQNNIKAGKQQKMALLQEGRHFAQTS